MKLLDNTMSKLSIVIPNYNGGENLKRSIGSCKAIQMPESNYEEGTDDPEELLYPNAFYAKDVEEYYEYKCKGNLPYIADSR